MLRLCSIAARGLWIEMMCLMHEAQPYGSLLVNGKRIDKRQLASLVGLAEKECSLLLMELEGNGVFSRDEDGTLYSRRMRRDFQKALEDKANGKKGGNPKVKVGVNPPVNPTSKTEGERRVEGADKAQIPEARAQNDTIVGASASRFTEGSKRLAETFWLALGITAPLQVPLELVGTDWRAVTWEQAGWPADMIDAEARRVGPGKPLTYYEKVFATAFAKRQAPLPHVEVRQPETLTVTHAKPQANSVVAAARRFAEQFERESSDSGGGNPTPVLRISAR